MLCTIASYADISFTVDGINYSAVSSNAPSCKVTAGTYSGDIVIPETVTYNGNEFTVTSIGYQAFKNSDIIGISLPPTVTSILYSAFYGCTSLKEIEIPSSVSEIEGSAFEDCINLKDIKLSSSLISIGDCAFCGCSDCA
jgi:hypothetical protein